MIRFVLALVCVLLAARAEAGGCGACVQAQAVYAAPVVQQFAFVPQVQAVQVQAYAAPVVQRQVVQSYAVPVIRERVVVKQQVAAYAAVQPVVVEQQRRGLFRRDKSVVVQRSRVRSSY